MSEWQCPFPRNTTDEQSSGVTFGSENPSRKYRQILSVFPNGRSVQIANKNKKGEPIMARRKKKDQEGPVETRENDRAAEIEYRVMLARNLERNFGFGF